jgi:hypothetical protein
MYDVQRSLLFVRSRRRAASRSGWGVFLLLEQFLEVSVQFLKQLVLLCRNTAKYTD